MGRSSGVPGLIVIICGFIGFLQAAIVYLLYEAEWMIHLYITDAADLPGLMGLIILIWLIFGAVLAAISQ